MKHLKYRIASLFFIDFLELFLYELEKNGHNYQTTKIRISIYLSKMKFTTFEIFQAVRFKITNTAQTFKIVYTN